MTTLTCLDAAVLALGDAMRADARVWALGEDLGRGGVFQQYRGLQAEFGPERVLDTPISESCILGAAVGAAMMGTRPVVEMRFADFALCAVDELVNQAAKARYMFGGQTRVPIVVRMPSGMWRNSAAQHSQCLEAWYAHMPGLAVVCPASPADLHDLLRAAIDCDDPVVFMEHKELWPVAGPLDPARAPARLGAARIVRHGRDLTLVSWSRMVHVAEQACAELAARGVEVELVDLRTIWPWDRSTVLGSAVKTGRLLVVHEAVREGGFGAEIAATVAEETGLPVARLGAPRVPVPFSPALEPLMRIEPATIAARAMRLLDEGGRG
jgi:pyruvate dehydrogenase E1 component beta subunit